MGYNFSRDFLSTISNRGDYIKNLGFAISDPKSRLCKDSRISLTYYSLCLRNGKYDVSLHFAENVYVREEDYCSQGRRIFDVYIQGERKLQDFATRGSLNDTNPQKITC